MSQEEDFITKLTQIAILQISEELNNKGMRESSLNTFTEVIQRFIQEIGSTASSFANASGRTECNYFDIELALKDIGYDISELVEFENNSYPLQTPIDIENLQISKHSKQNNNKNTNNTNNSEYINYESIKIDELMDSITNNKYTHNGTIIFDSKKDIFEILHKQTGINNKNKRKKNKKLQSKTQRNKRMKHIPLYCPDYPDNLLYKNTPIYYKGIRHHDDDNKSNEISKKIKEDNFEKTRNILIEHSNVFSSYENKNRINRNNKREIFVDMNRNNNNMEPPIKKQKLNAGNSKNINDKMENDDDDDDIIDNPYAS
eukprot:25548_1